MHFKSSLALAVATAATSVSAFSNTSPHLFFANANNLPHHDSALALQQQQQREAAANAAFVVDATEFDQSVLAAVKGCPADAYLLVDIPGLHAADLAATNAAAATLRRLYDAAPEKFAYQYVLDAAAERASQQTVVDELVSKCGAEVVEADTAAKTFSGFVDATARVIKFDFAPLPSDDADKRAEELDADLQFALETVAQGSLPSPNYVVVLTSSPAADAHVSTTKHRKASKGSDAVPKLTGNSLFDRYVFFGTGIFETSLVAILLLVVLFTALSWLTDLKISYQAFEKPAGPGAGAASKAQ